MSAMRGKWWTDAGAWRIVLSIAYFAAVALLVIVARITALR
jgi:hypothetical protein